MRKLSYILALSAAVLLTVGCVKQTVEQPHSCLPADGVLRVAPAVGNMTRAVSYETATLGNFGLSITRTGETNPPYVGSNMEVTPAGVMPSTLYWKDSSPITVTAYAPYVADITNPVKPWSVPDNQSAVEPKDVDFLWCQKTVDPKVATDLDADGKIPVVLQHRMSKMTVTITVAGSLAGTFDANGTTVKKTTLRDMTVSNVLRSGTVNVGTGEVVANDSRGITHLAPDAPKTTFEGIFFPQSTVGATADDDAVLALNILYRQSASEQGIEFPFGIALKDISWTSGAETKSFTAFETNKHYKIALTVSSNELSATLTVEDWNEGRWSNGESDLTADAIPVVDTRIHIGSLETSDMTWPQFVAAVNNRTLVPEQIYVLDQDVSQNSTIGSYNTSANSARPMNATLDGDGHTINLAIGDGRGRYSYQGLFAYVTGTVKNLKLTGYVSYATDERNDNSAQYLGSVAGYNYGTIYGITSSVTVQGYSYVGGLVGINYGTVGSTDGKCTVSGTIRGAYRTGGAVGTNCLRVENIASSAIVNAQSTGNGTYYGGVVGENWNGARIDGCSFTGTLSGSSDYVGGIAGANRYSTSGSIITICSMEGAISNGFSRSGIASNENHSAIVGCWTIPTWSNTNYGGIVDKRNNYGIVSWCYTTYNNIIFAQNSDPENCQSRLADKAAILGKVDDMNSACASGTYASKYKFAADGSIVVR